MQQPEGYVQNNKLVCKLHKAIYGLKQAPRVWYEKLKSTLSSLGFSPTKSDNALYVKLHEGKTVYILVYVDDILVTGDNDEEVNKIISYLNHTFSIKDLGNLNYFLGIEILQKNNTEIILSQKKYISEILTRAKMD